MGVRRFSLRHFAPPVITPVSLASSQGTRPCSTVVVLSDLDCIRGGRALPLMKRLRSNEPKSVVASSYLVGSYPEEQTETLSDFRLRGLAFAVPPEHPLYDEFVCDSQQNNLVENHFVRIDRDRFGMHRSPISIRQRRETFTFRTSSGSTTTSLSLRPRK
jgi:hypothetical protein